jgi:hypothetical protein
MIRAMEEAYSLPKLEKERKTKKPLVVDGVELTTGHRELYRIPNPEGEENGIYSVSEKANVKLKPETKYDVRYVKDGPEIVPHSCRDFGCSGLYNDIGHGHTFEEAKVLFVHHYKQEIEKIKATSETKWLNNDMLFY